MNYEFTTLNTCIMYRYSNGLMDSCDVSKYDQDQNIPKIITVDRGTDDTNYEIANLTNLSKPTI